MTLLNIFKLKPAKNVLVYKSTPYFKGHAKLVSPQDLALAASYGHAEMVDSQAFERLQARAAKDQVKVVWLP